MSEARALKIKIVGIGNGGNRHVDRMIENGLETRAEFVAISCDSFEKTKATKVLIDKGPHGLDGGSVKRYEKAARDSRDEIVAALDGADVIVLVSGFGGFFGTGATPIVAEFAQKLGAMTLAVVTYPFGFEGSGRLKRAAEGLIRLAMRADSIIVVGCDQVIKTLESKTPLSKAFEPVTALVLRHVENILSFAIKESELSPRLNATPFDKLFERKMSGEFDRPSTPKKNVGEIELPPWMRSLNIREPH